MNKLEPLGVPSVAAAIVVSATAGVEARSSVESGGGLGERIGRFVPTATAPESEG